MKKTYFTPALNAVMIRTAQMMVQSPYLPVDPDPEDGVDNMHSNKFQGLLWEDDEEK